MRIGGEGGGGKAPYIHIMYHTVHHTHNSWVSLLVRRVLTMK